MKHTPAPWFIRYCDDAYCQCMTVISSKDYGPSNTTQFNDEEDTIAIVSHQLTPLVEEHEPNIRLIAAAPDLLEALVALHKAVDSCIDLTPEVMKKAKAAIDKATTE